MDIQKYAIRGQLRRGSHGLDRFFLTLTLLVLALAPLAPTFAPAAQARPSDDLLALTTNTLKLSVASTMGPVGDLERYGIECTSPSAGGMPADSDEAMPVTLSGLPESPSQLRASQVTSTTITLSWQDNSDNEQGFTIERWVNGGWWTLIAHVGANVTMCQSIGLPPNMIYAYRVQAFNADGVSEYSQAVTAVTK